MTLDETLKHFNVPNEEYANVPRPRIPVFIDPEHLADLRTWNTLITEQTRQIANECDNKCAANPLPTGYYYGPMQLKYSESDPITNIITVTAYREVYKERKRVQL